jgi:hypothetical protein
MKNINSMISLSINGLTKIIKKLLILSTKFYQLESIWKKMDFLSLSSLKSRMMINGNVVQPYLIKTLMSKSMEESSSLSHCLFLKTLSDTESKLAH